MGVEELQSRDIIGDFIYRLEQKTGQEWINDLSMLFPSDKSEEVYKWLGMISGGMREWIGPRHAKGMVTQGITIPNVKYEDTVEYLVEDIERDKTGQIALRLLEMADRANAHWAELLTTRIENGETALCYDGQAFFDTDHVEGASGIQSNDLTYDASVTTLPSAAEMEAAILASVGRILSQKDNTGKPMNENASSFRVMVPWQFLAPAAAALKNPVIVDSNGSRTNTLTNIGGFKFALDVNVRLTWTTKFATFRTDGNVKPLIRQSEKDVDYKVDDSQVFSEGKHRVGIDARRGTHYGYWQHACLTTLI